MLERVPEREQLNGAIIIGKSIAAGPVNDDDPPPPDATTGDGATLALMPRSDVMSGETPRETGDAGQWPTSISSEDESRVKRIDLKKLGVVMGTSRIQILACPPSDSHLSSPDANTTSGRASGAPIDRRCCREASRCRRRSRLVDRRSRLRWPTVTAGPRPS